jgi:hypothetical protein
MYKNQLCKIEVFHNPNAPTETLWYSSLNAFSKKYKMVAKWYKWIGYYGLQIIVLKLKILSTLDKISLEENK